MRKKIFLLVFTLVVVTLTAFTGYKTFYSKVQIADLMLVENIEALSRGEEHSGYFVHHMKYYNPVTNLETDKCTAFSYYGPNGACLGPHDHGATTCCSVNC
ncbi:hypothetical protein DEM91_07925 [Prevotella sp. TCVGH]|nr:hypothetical protein [Prevotella sp. TCVGH]